VRLVGHMWYQFHMDEELSVQCDESPGKRGNALPLCHFSDAKPVEPQCVRLAEHRVIVCGIDSIKLLYFAFFEPLVLPTLIL